MFARLMIAPMKIDKLDEAINIYMDGIGPAVKSQKGYVGAYLLVDRKTGKVISISLWDNEEEAIANEKSGYLQEQVVKLKEFFTAPVTREGYEANALD